MTKNKKVKIILVIVIILLAIFFAIVTSNIIKIKSNKIMVSEIERFTRNIRFSKHTKREPYMEFNGKTENNGTLTLLNEGHEIIFETPLFEKIGDKAIIHYWITNENGEEAKIGNLICKKNLIEDEDIESLDKKQVAETETPEKNDLNEAEDKKTTKEEKIESNVIEDIDEYILITSKNELKDTTISGGETSVTDGTIEIELLKPYTGPKEKLTYRISCTIEATREARS